MSRYYNTSYPQPVILERYRDHVRAFDDRYVLILNEFLDGEYWIVLNS